MTTSQTYIPTEVSDAFRRHTFSEWGEVFDFAAENLMEYTGTDDLNTAIDVLGNRYGELMETWPQTQQIYVSLIFSIPFLHTVGVAFPEYKKHEADLRQLTLPLAVGAHVMQISECLNLFERQKKFMGLPSHAPDLYAVEFFILRNEVSKLKAICPEIRIQTITDFFHIEEKLFRPEMRSQVMSVLNTALELTVETASVIRPPQLH